MRIRIFGQYVHASIVALAAAELLIAFAAMVWVSAPGEDIASVLAAEDRETVWVLAGVYSIALCVGFISLGLYSARQRAQSAGILARLVVAIAVGSGVAAIAASLLPVGPIGMGAIAAAACAVLATSSVARIGLGRLVDQSMFKRRILVYGSGQRAAAVAELRRRSDTRGFVVAGFVQPEGEGQAVPENRVLDASHGLTPLVERHDVDEVVVAMEDRRRAFPIRDLLECRLAGIEVTELLTFLERETGRVRIDALNPSWIIFGEGFRRDPLRRFSSRTLDLVTSSLILVVTLPAMLLTAMLIKLEDGWRAPVLYRQERVGLGGATFRLLKFRSMRIDAERDGQARWAEKNDPRITRVGAVIRTLRIDELPQILNVLRGHMSFVGPRPERPEFVRELADKVPYYVQRHCVRPGITGWAQLCYRYGSSEQDALEKLQYDLYYIKNNSLLFDVTILVQTAEVVFMGKGAR